MPSSHVLRKSSLAAKVCILCVYTNHCGLSYYCVVKEVVKSCFSYLVFKSLDSTKKQNYSDLFLRRKKKMHSNEDGDIVDFMYMCS